MGCGKSEGTFDAQQPVENSADEAVAAIDQLIAMKVAGVETIGCWGLSRAGWIVPLINERYPIDFWISVSGTNDKENFGYLLKENLLIEGKSPAEAERLYQAWMDLKTALSSDKEEAVLEECIRGDKNALHEYRYVLLENDVPEHVKYTVRKQMKKIESSLRNLERMEKHYD